MRRTGDTLGFIGVSLLIITLSFMLARGGTPERSSFKAFYCAGAAIDAHRDPYLVEPLRSCERHFVAKELPPGYVEPAPLPGYTLALFGPLARLPAVVAAEVFCAILALATIATAAFIAAISDTPKTAVLLALMPLALLNAAYGELPPIAMLGIAAAAYFLARRKYAAAGVAVCVALIEPNVGLVAAVAAFAFLPRTRLAISASAAFLAIASVLALGVTTNIEYFSVALPIQQISELVASDQYSSSRILYELGFAPNVCIAVAKGFFFLMAAFSIVLAWQVSKRTHRHEFIALIPPAVILFGGIYVHDIQMILALPAAITVAAIKRAPLYKWTAALSTVLLSLVWTEHAGRAVVALSATCAAGVLFALSNDSERKRVFNAAIGAVCAVVAVIIIQRAQRPIAPSAFTSRYFDALPSEIAAIAWARYLNATPALTHTEYFLKLPSWIGLLGLIVCCVSLALNREAGVEPPYASPLRMA